MNELGGLAGIKTCNPAVNQIRYTRACDQALRSLAAWLPRLTQRGCERQIDGIGLENFEAAVWLVR